MMKYNNTLSCSDKMKKSSFTIYTDLDLSHTAMVSSEDEISSIRGELEIVQKQLTLQTRRCRQLVTEFTKRLQDKERQFQTEKNLREDQLAKVLRALIIFESRLKQEQKFISHQLKEKDYIIRNQSNELKKLLGNQYCKNCNQYYSESLDSSSEYQVTDYQSSNFESLDSSSDIYATISERSFVLDKEEGGKFTKNTGKSSLNRKGGRKLQHKKSVGSYFEVLKIRSDAQSPCSNEDNTSNDYDNLDSLQSASLNDDSTIKEEEEEKKTTISELIPTFDGDGETNDNWYASGSEQEDDQQRDIYRNNPVLECMNQILLQNINDSGSPPKTPNLDRKTAKKVKFSDEEAMSPLTKENLDDGGYETPIQKPPNFYETPQSIYSNDYEQILSKSSSTSSSKTNHVYVDLDAKTPDKQEPEKKKVPPALPPKPANLVLKYKPQPKPDVDSEPDYCSISELNLPVPKKLVVAEINSPSSQDVIKAKKKLEKKCEEIPKLPQVSEILIPEDEERVSQDNYVKNNSQILKLKKKIVMGSSVSSLISGFNTQLISEINKKPLQAPEFDLSQNFEEFKLEDEIEEYNVNDIPEEEELKKEEGSRVELIRATDLPVLNASSVELLKKQLELQKTQLLQQNQNYEHFLECTGLSSKAILTPSRLLSNHKSMLKPKDIKFRSKVNKAFERNSTGTIKYWSEPYI